jgi:hypothetical protein
LHGYIAQANQHLPGLMQACYIEGSLALGGFNARLSDIDFVALLQHPMTPSELESLRAIHRAIAKNTRAGK